MLTSPAYRRSLSDKLESNGNNKKPTATAARHRLSTAKKGFSSNQKSNKNKKIKSKVKASGRQ